MPCCNLCTEAFVPMKQEPLKKPVPDVPVPFMADVNGYVIPDVVLTALLDVSTGTKCVCPSPIVHS